MKRHLLTAICLFLVTSSAARAMDDSADALPPNLGHSLRQLVVWHRAQPGNLSASERQTRLMKSLPGRARRMQTDADATRAVVKITLDGAVPAAEVRSNLISMGLAILATDKPGYGGAVFSAQMPLGAAERVARLPGVHSVALVHRPWKHIGKVTTSGVFYLDATGLGADADGAGITVGVLSDSFDVATQDLLGKPLQVHAADDIASGDLPGAGNPYARFTPVHVLAEGARSSDQPPLDEGRAMLQIIHDLAPGASLAFATAGVTPEVFATNIRALRADPAAHCDVIVDDITFPDEPMFFDGPVARAVYEVTHDGALNGHKVLYYSAAGNEGDHGYVADFLPVDTAAARNGGFKGNLKLDQVPSALDANGYHNFDARPGKIHIAQKVVITNDEAEVSLQWDSPPGQTGIDAADFNLLVFDSSGNYLPELSGKDHNVVMGNTLELVDLPAGDGGGKMVYQIAIVCAQRNSTSPRHLRYVVNTNGTFTAKFTGHNAPTIFGHAAAVGADAVAATGGPASVPPERYSSLGPVTIFFDREGNPQTPEIRQQPTLTGVDGANNTFLGEDTDGDGFPNFYGTSAAAPHAAACAALLLQRAGGPGTLTNQQMRTLLQTAIPAHNVSDLNSAAVTGQSSGGSVVTLAEVRDDLDPAGTKKFYRLSFTGADTQSLRKIVITLNQSAMTFDESVATGAPFAVGAVAGGPQKSDVTAVIDGLDAGESAQNYQNRLTLNFTPGSFGPGASVCFGLGINKLRDSRGMDPLQWAMADTKFNATLKGGSKAKVQGTTVPPAHGHDWSPFIGAGLIDIRLAIASLEANGPPITADSRTALTPGNVLLTTNDERVVEATREGTIVQSFSISGAQASAVLADGTVAVLCKTTGGPSITLFTPLTGDTRTVTFPGWQQPVNAYTANQIVSQGNYVFVIDASVPRDTGGPASRILRYDPANAVWQSFGEADVYTSLIGGRDGLVHATVGMNFFLLEPTEVYDPYSLQKVRTEAPMWDGRSSDTNLWPPAAVDGAGNIYKLTTTGSGNGQHTVLKTAPDGTKIAAVDPALIGNNIIYSFANLQVGADGKVFVSVTDGFLAISPAFDKVTKYTVFTHYHEPEADHINSTLVVIGQ